MKKLIVLPFGQNLEVSSNSDFTETQSMFIDNIEEFAKEAIEVLKETELNWKAKLGRMTNIQYALDRCKLIQRDIHKLGKLGIRTTITKA